MGKIIKTLMVRLMRLSVKRKKRTGKNFGRTARTRQPVCLVQYVLKND